jgi:hypothetical protein
LLNYWGISNPNTPLLIFEVMIIRPQNSITRNTVILTKTAPDTTDTGIEDVLYLFGKTFYK